MRNLRAVSEWTVRPLRSYPGHADAAGLLARRAHCRAAAGRNVLLCGRGSCCGSSSYRHDLPFAQAALLGCAVATGVGAALFTAAVQPGESVAVLGTGGVGLNILQGARLAGASTIIAVDRSDERLAMTPHFGATHTVNAADAGLVDKVRGLTQGRGCDYVFEVVGLPSLMRKAIDMLGRGGELVLVGAAPREAEMAFPPRQFMSRQQVIRGSIYGNIRPSIHLPLFADWCCDGRIDAGSLITRTVTLADVPALFADPGRPGGIRTVIEWPATDCAS